jgi:hypothetical protein
VTVLALVALILGGIDVSGDDPMGDGRTLAAVALVFTALPGPECS